MIFTLSRDTISPDLRRMMAVLRNPQPVLEAGGKVLQVEIVRHLRRMEQRGNERGWPSQRFFAGGPDSVDKRVGLAADGVRAVITIADPRFYHHVTGGTVTAKRAGALTIPLTAEAARYAGRGSLRQSAPFLKLIRTKAGAFLARVLGQSATFLFILLRSVRHRPHPQVLPNLREIEPRVAAGMTNVARRLLRGQS